MTAAAQDLPRGKSIESLPIASVVVGPNVRKDIPAASLAELAETIKVHGVIQPIKVVAQEDGTYQTVWGQRRRLAAELAGLTSIPAIVIDTIDAGTAAQTAIEQLVENRAREDLNPMDEARAVVEIIETGMKKSEIAKRLGMSPSALSHVLSLTKLPKQVIDQVDNGQLSGSHAKTLVGLPAEQAIELADEAIHEDLSAHELEVAAGEWKRENDLARKRETGKAERLTSSIDRAIAGLKAQDIPTTTPLYVGADSWEVDDRALATAVEAAGFTLGERYVQMGRRPDGCDCTCLQVRVHDKTVEVFEACDNRDHYEAEYKAKNAARELRSEVENAAREDLREAIVVAGAISPMIARLIVAKTEYQTTWTKVKELSDEDAINQVAKWLTNPTYGWAKVPMAKVAEALRDGGETPDEAEDAPSE